MSHEYTFFLSIEKLDDRYPYNYDCVDFAKMKKLNFPSPISSGMLESKAEMQNLDLGCQVDTI